LRRLTRSRLATLASGAAIAALGVVLLLSSESTIHLGGGWLGAALAACAGVALLASGIGARDE
jgi:hypothetical protein